MCDMSGIDELRDQLAELIEKIDDLQDTIESTVEDAVSDAVEDAVENAVSDAMEDASAGASAGTKPTMYLLSQDKKELVPFYSARARRNKKGEEVYVIDHVFPGWRSTVVGRYENKAAALAEMKNIADALCGGCTLYEMK